MINNLKKQGTVTTVGVGVVLAAFALWGVFLTIMMILGFIGISALIVGYFYIDKEIKGESKSPKDKKRRHNG